MKPMLFNTDMVKATKSIKRPEDYSSGFPCKY